MEDHFEQIGERLRHAREIAGMEVDDVVFKTRLPRSAIEALEAENFSHFISPVYAKSFLAQYSCFLNVDATQWLDALKPSAFIEGDPLLPLLETSGMAAMEAPASGGSRGGWSLSLWPLLFSCAIVLGVIKAYEFFESRSSDNLSGQSRGQTPMISPAIAPQPESVSPPVHQTEASVPKTVPEAFNPAPRAIIVR